jgi:hypothetical protein
MVCIPGQAALHFQVFGSIRKSLHMDVLRPK